MKAKSVGLLVLSFAIAAPIPGWSKNRTSLARFVDQDAAVVLRVDSKNLQAAANLAAAMPGRVGAAIAAVRTGSQQLLGYDLLSTDGWKAAGLDVHRPVWVQVAAIDGHSARKVYHRLAGHASWTPGLLRKTKRIFWRSRIVLPIRSRRRARTFLFAITSALTEMTRTRVKNRDRLAMMLGGRPRDSKKIINTLAGRHAIAAIGWLDGLDAYVILRITRRYALIEVVSPFAGVPVEWRRDQRSFLSSLAEIRNPRGFSGHLETSAATALKSPGVHLWFNASGLRGVLLAIEHTDVLRRLALSGNKPGRSPTPCVDLDRLATSGTIDDFAMSLEADSHEVRLQALWGLRATTQWLADLIDPIPLSYPRGAIFRAALYLSGLDRLSRLDKPRSLRAGFASGLRSLLRCRGGSLAALLILNWPELLSAYVSDLRGTHPAADDIVSKIGPTILAIRSAAGKEHRAIAVLETIMTGNRRVVTELFELVFGQRQERQRLHVWGKGPILAYEQERGERIGFALGERSLNWWNEDRETDRGHGDRIWGSTHARLAPLLSDLAGDIPLLTPLSVLARNRLGTLRAVGDISANTIRWRATVEQRP